MNIIDNILKSPLIVYPWKHQYIETFFNLNDFEKISTDSKLLQEKYKDQLITGNDFLNLAEVADFISDESFNIILESNTQILNNIENIVRLYPNHYKHVNYVSFPVFHILPPYTDWQKIHDESSDKTISIVVYLYPNSSVGTTLYKNKNRDSYVKEIQWKPNNAMLFCGENNVTWHDFCSKETPRVTLNYFVRNIRSTELKNDDDKLYWEFGNGLKTFIPKNISKEKLNLLTSGILFRKF